MNLEPKPIICLHSANIYGEEQQAMSTRAIQLLKKKRVAFEIVKYAHKQKGARFAAEAVGFPLNKTIKTLVVALDNKAHALVLMPGDCQLSLKKVAKACRVKKAAMADTATAERLTGYLVGGISPFGTQKTLAVVMEAGLGDHDQVMINGGQRGILIRMDPADIANTLNAAMVDLAQE